MVEEPKALIPSLGKGLMYALSHCCDRVRGKKDSVVRGGDLVLELITRYRLRRDFEPVSEDLAAHLGGRDFDRYVSEADRIPSDHRIERAVSDALNETVWRANSRNDDAARGAEVWGPDVRTLLYLASDNAAGEGQTAVSWYHCMNMVFAAGMLEPRVPLLKDGEPVVGVASPSPWLPFVDLAKTIGVVDSKAPKALTGAVLRASRVVRPEVRRYGPVGFILQREAVREAVRRGDEVVMPVHVLTAVLSAAEQLRLVPGVLDGRFASDLRAGASLLDNGVDTALIRTLTSAETAPAPVPRYEGRLWRPDRRDPAVGMSAFALFEDAVERGGRPVGDGDLVRAVAACDDPVIRSLLETIDLDV